ncbi:hypothetical protein GCM10027072_69710 [Streptomyces bullii]
MARAGITRPTQDARVARHKGAQGDVPGLSSPLDGRSWRLSRSLPGPATSWLGARKTRLPRRTRITQDACMSTTGEAARRAVVARTGVAP